MFSNLDSNQHPDRGGSGPAQEELHAGRALREVGGAGRPQLQEPHHTGQFDTCPLLLLLIILKTESLTDTGNLAILNEECELEAWGGANGVYFEIPNWIETESGD